MSSASGPRTARRICTRVRAAALTVRQLDYVAAAHLRGARGPAIMRTEILPTSTGPIVIEATVRVGYAIFASASLRFLGLGVPPPRPTGAP